MDVPGLAIYTRILRTESKTPRLMAERFVEECIAPVRLCGKVAMRHLRGELEHPAVLGRQGETCRPRVADAREPGGLAGGELAPANAPAALKTQGRRRLLSCQIAGAGDPPAPRAARA